MSDRAAAIVIAALIELRLSLAIKSRLQQDQAIIDRTFRVSGSLGSFAPKIDLAFLMEVITKEAHTDLVTFKNIRNDFAHQLHALDLSAASIKKDCQRLKLIEMQVADIEEAEAHERLSKPSHHRMTLQVSDYAAHIADPRGRYVLTGRLFVAALDPQDFRKTAPPYL
jgi:hypothetical protein